MAYVSPPSVTAGVTPVKGSWANTVKSDLDDHESRLLVVEGFTGVAATSDPSSPVENQWWIYTDGASPATVYLKIHSGGTTYALPLGTLA